VSIFWATLVVSLVELQISRDNLGTPFNGYGALGDTWHRRNQAPMRYRALMAWLIGWMPDSRARLVLYLLARAIMTATTLFLAEAVLGDWRWMALALVATSRFDYWEHYPELVGILGILSGNPYWAAIGAVGWGLSRETAWMALPMAAATGQWWALMALPALAAVRIGQGRAELYCERWTFWALNWPDIQSVRARFDPYPPIAIILSIGALVVPLWGDMSWALQRTAWAAPIFVVAAWTLARPREIRILLPTAIWMIGAWG